MKKNPRVIIMAAGQGKRWGSGYKHLCVIDGETLLERTVRQVKQYTDDIFITTNTEKYKTEGAELFYPEKYTNKHEVDRFLSNRSIWGPTTVFLYGDVYYTDNAIKKIFTTSCRKYRFYGRLGESTVGGKDHAELFAVRVRDLDLFEQACKTVKGSTRNGWGWLVYRVLMGGNADISVDLLRKWLLEVKHTNFTVIDDETDDFDRKTDFMAFAQRRRDDSMFADGRIPTISVNIMAHPSRVEMAEELSISLGGAKIIWDEIGSVGDTRRRCLLDHIEQDKDFALTVQDDCIVCEDFFERAIEFMLDIGKYAVYNFFAAEYSHDLGLFLKGVEQGYFEKNRLHNEVAFAMPTREIKSLIKYCEISDRQRDDDFNVQKYFLHNGIMIYFCVPSIVQHKDDIPSIYYRGMKPNRGAWWYVDEPNPLEGGVKYGYRKDKTGKYKRTIIGYGENKR